MLGTVDFMACSTRLDMHTNCIHIYLHAHIHLNSHITGQKRVRNYLTKGTFQKATKLSLELKKLLG